MDILLQKFFEKERWEDALEVGVGKGIDKGEGWRMFALMKKVIADNNFDFNKRMSEIYGK